MPDFKQIFLDAYGIIQDRDRWTQRWYARDEFGKGCRPDASGAVCFCSIGALIKVSDAGTTQAMIKDVFDPVVLEILKTEGASLDLPPGLAPYNDHRPHEKVVALWETVGQSHGWLK